MQRNNKSGNASRSLALPMVFALVAAALIGFAAGFGLAIGITLTHHAGRIAAFWPAKGPLIALFLSLMLFLILAAALLASRRTFESRLQEEKTRYRLLADNSRDIVVLSDLEGRRIYVSPAVKDVLGWTPEEWTGANAADLMHPDDVPGFKVMLQEMLSGSDRRIFSYRTRKKDDSYLWMEASVRVLRDEGTGEPSSFVANVRDISRRVEAEEKLDLAYRQMRQLATLDGLTSLPNRRRFDEVLEVEWRRAMRNNQSIALLMVDLDHFKRVNDLYGHRAGDLCLQTVAMVIADCMRRPGDAAARYGGEEFAVILPDTDAEGARHLGELLREKIHNAHTDIGVGDPITLSASVGVASRVPRMYERADPLVEAADRALYDAKKAGRDRVQVFHSS
ncbi:MAG TPA: diguanylate cyclase [Acidobacteriaceae bacterium]|nr:diguanylate cyclase [Acidobacteriaceae bacterium]